MIPQVTTKGLAESTDGCVTVRYAAAVSDRIECTFTVGRAADDYVFFPAAAYDGNRFEAVTGTGYPPSFDLAGRRSRVPLITDVPRLCPDGSGAIELTTGDVSVPCVGVYRPSEKRAYFLWTVQSAAGVNLGLMYEDGRIVLSCPARRRKVYTMALLSEAALAERTFSAGETVVLPFRFDVLPCDGLEAFFGLFFDRRGCMGLPSRPPHNPGRAETVALLLDNLNRRQWSETLGCYTAGADFRDNPHACWQAGWVGGSITAYAALKTGGAMEKERAEKTLAHLLGMQTGCGLFRYGCAADGTGFGSGFLPGTERWLLTRAAGDVLYYSVLSAALLERAGRDTARLDAAMRRLADALVRIYAAAGEWGQILDCETGEVIVAGSSSGAIVPAALVKAYERYGVPDYLSTASAAGRDLYEHVRHGYVCGGPGDELQGADSESAYGMTESMVCLYEAEGGAWLDRATTAAALLSSWVVPYDYVFPADCTFGRMGMKTTGTVFANIQNKHAAPGLCTYSGSALARLSRYTGDGRYAAMLSEISSAMPQYLSADRRPIPLGLYGQTGYLTPGSINERVNMSDWEGTWGVGEIFGSSCWSGIALLLADDPETGGREKA